MTKSQWITAIIGSIIVIVLIEWHERNPFW